MFGLAVKILMDREGMNWDEANQVVAEYEENHEDPIGIVDRIVEEAKRIDAEFQQMFQTT